MLNLIVFILLLAVVWLGLRHRRLLRGVSELEESIRARRVYLSDDPALSAAHPAWRRLASAASDAVSEIRRLGEQSADQLRQMEATLQCLQEAVLVIDSGNYILLANQAVQTISATREPPVGQRLEAVLKSGELAKFVSTVREGSDVGRAEIELAAASGSVWVEAAGSVITGGRGEGSPWVLVVLHDVTRRRRLEAVRQEFVANVSHELKTPLSVIKGYADTLVDEHSSMDPDIRDQFVNTIARHAARLTAVVHDLLELSRLDSERTAFGGEPNDLAEFIHSTARDARLRLRESGYELRVELGDRPIPVRMDPLRLSMVYSNLIDNARQYTPRGSTVTLGARQSANKAEVEVWVADDGPGIPQGELGRIFERFYRVEKGRSRETGGTGLGLSIVKHIIQLHGGRVWAESEPGAGTRIVFRLPLAGNGGTSARPVAALQAEG